MAKKKTAIEKEREAVIHRYQNLLVAAPKTLQDASECCPFHNLNGRSAGEYGDGSIPFDPYLVYFPMDPVLKKEIVDPFARVGGWDPQETAIGVRMTPEEVEDAVKRLTNQWKVFKDAAATGEKDRELELQEFEHIHVRRGKIKPPKIRPIMGNRRFSQIININVTMIKKAKGDVSVRNTFIPLLILDTPDGRFFDPEHEKVFMLRENDKDKGFKPLSMHDLVINAYHFLIDLGKKRSWLDRNTTLCSGNNRERVAGWTYLVNYDLENDFGLRILERLSPNMRYLKDDKNNFVTDEDGNKVENPDWIDVRKFTAAVWQGPSKEGPYQHYPMLNLVNLAEDIDDLNRKRQKTTAKSPEPKPEVERPTRDEVIKWLDYWQNDEGGGQHQIMNRDQIQSLSKLAPSRSARDMAKAIWEKDETALKRNSERSVALNWVYLCDETVYHSVAALAAVIKERKLDDEIVVKELDALTAKLEELEVPEEVKS